MVDEILKTYLPWFCATLYSPLCLHAETSDIFLKETYKKKEIQIPEQDNSVEAHLILHSTGCFG